MANDMPQHVKLNANRDQVMLAPQPDVDMQLNQHAAEDISIPSPFIPCGNPVVAIAHSS